MAILDAYGIYHFLFICFASVLFKTGSHYAALNGLKLAMLTKLALNLHRSSCLCISSAETRGVCCHGRLYHLVLVQGLRVLCDTIPVEM